MIEQDKNQTTKPLINLKINGQTATLRTRRVIKNSGPMFELWPKTTNDPKRRDWTLIKSTRTGWFGWLPNNEFIIENKKEV
jgi:hypothetical protein